MRTEVKDSMHELMAEHGVLGGVLFEEGTLPVARAVLRPEHFSAPQNAAIFEAMCALADEGEGVDVTTVWGRLETTPGVPSGADVNYLAVLVDAVVDAANVGSYARIVREASDRRMLVARARDAIRRIEGGERAREALDWLNATCGDAVYIPQSKGFNIGDRMADVLDADTAGAISLQLPCLMDYVEPLDRGGQLIIGGTPGSGKTALTTQILLAQARAGLRVSFLSGEMSEDPIIRRLLAQVTGVAEGAIKARKLRDDEMKAISTAAVDLKEVSFRFVDCAGYTPHQLLATADREFRTADVVAYDYLQLCRGGGERRDEIDSLSAGFKSLARRHEGVSILCSQLRRTGDERRRPRVSDLKESGALEADADAVLLLNVPEEDRGNREIIIGKQRHGESGTVFGVSFDGRCFRFGGAEK